MPDKNSAQCLKAELYINKSGVKDDTWTIHVSSLTPLLFIYIYIYMYVYVYVYICICICSATTGKGCPEACRTE